MNRFSQLKVISAKDRIAAAEAREREWEQAAVARGRDREQTAAERAEDRKKIMITTLTLWPSSTSLPKHH